jgi:hypothetical protein
MLVVVDRLAEDWSNQHTSDSKFHSQTAEEIRQWAVFKDTSDAPASGRRLGDWVRAWRRVDRAEVRYTGSFRASNTLPKNFVGGWP